MDETPALERPTTAQAFARVVTCPPLVYASSSIFILGAAAATTTAAIPFIFGVAATLFATAAFLYIGAGAVKDTMAGRRYQVPYRRQAQSNYVLGGLETAQLATEVTTRLINAPHEKLNQVAQSLLEMAHDKSMIALALLVPAYFVWASASGGEVKRKRREDAGEPPPHPLNMPTTRWAIGDTIANLMSLPGALAGIVATGLSMTRKAAYDVIDVKHWRDFLVKHVTPMRVGATSYVGGGMALANVHWAYFVGYAVLSSYGYICYDGESTGLNRSLAKDFAKAFKPMVRAIGAELAASKPLLSQPYRSFFVSP